MHPEKQTPRRPFEKGTESSKVVLRHLTRRQLFSKDHQEKAESMCECQQA